MAASFHSKPKPTTPPATANSDTGVPHEAKPARWTPYLAGLLFVVAFAWSAGILDKAATLGVRFFELYVQSQLAMNTP